jgi:adenylate kinase family enzyme
MPPPHDLLLIAGIPGAGKTWYGDKFAEEFEFVHYDLEDRQTLDRFAANATQFIADAVGQDRSVVVTWGFVPDNHPCVSAVLQFRSAGFKLIWFDGARPAALREFQKRGTVSEELFYLQMFRIENSRIIDQLRATIVNPFDSNGQFKSAADLLEEIRQKETP